VDVEVPRVLATGGLVVLTGRDAVAAVRFPHGDGDLANGVVHGVAVLGGQVVDVLVVRVGDDDDVAAVVRPPPGSDERGRQFGAEHDVVLAVDLGLPACEQEAERALVPVRRVAGRHRNPPSLLIT
jgi:hypothetical protein